MGETDLISRQAAIEAIEQMQMPIMRSEFPEEQLVFTGMSEALQAIKELPSAYPERCECCETLSKTQLLIPQPERKKGKWIETDSHEPCWYKCDQCGRLSDIKEIYCPTCGASMVNTTCGADMRGESNEAD